MLRFELGIWNAWLMSAPFLALIICMVGRKKDVIGRMSDMTGYKTLEKLVAISASFSPYPLMIATLWTPFTSNPALFFFGLLIYTVGMALCAASVKVIIETPPDEPFTTGPYRFSRNPMYVSATAVFAGTCIATANPVLTGYLVLVVLLQHFMILAEERVCRSKYGESFERYLGRVPRYLLFV